MPDPYVFPPLPPKSRSPSVECELKAHRQNVSQVNKISTESESLPTRLPNYAADIPFVQSYDTQNLREKFGNHIDSEFRYNTAQQNHAIGQNVTSNTFARGLVDSLCGGQADQSDELIQFSAAEFVSHLTTPAYLDVGAIDESIPTTGDDIENVNDGKKDVLLSCFLAFFESKIYLQFSNLNLNFLHISLISKFEIRFNISRRYFFKNKTGLAGDHSPKWRISSRRGYV